jgi:predicted PurR-regulated permease PerM
MAKLIKALLVLAILLNISLISLSIKSYSSLQITNSVEVNSKTQDNNKVNNQAIVQDTLNESKQTLTNNPQAVVIDKPNVFSSNIQLIRTGGYAIGSIFVSLFTIIIITTYTLYEHKKTTSKK